MFQVLPILGLPHALFSRNVLCIRKVHTIPPKEEQVVKIVDTTFRDGIQKWSYVIPFNKKLAVIRLLAESGFYGVEIGSFVKGLPNVDRPEELYNALGPSPALLDVLVPNEKGFLRALESCSAKKPMRISLFTAASDTFAVKNSGLPFEKSLEQFTSIVPRAKMKGLAVRAYLSCAFGCPFEGDDPLERAPLMTRRLLDIGCDEVVPSDTTGVGTERKIHAFAIGLLKASSNDLAVFKKIALHLHGDDLDRVGAGLLWGIARYDASLGRVGGCPATTQSKHNLNVMDLLNYLKKQGYVTGIDLEKVRQAEALFNEILRESAA